MEGVMMRNGEVYGLAVRQPDGNILARRLPWFSLTRRPWLRLPFVRGFPILLETLVNGIRALNHSVEMAEGGNGNTEPLSPWQTFLTLALALLMAVGLFVVAPHLLSLIMLWLHLGGDVEGLSFHIWDGFFKCCIFVAYIWIISLVPEIRRVFQYHGAEHKTIHAFESGSPVAATEARKLSRLHPRCGTTFLLFVICISIILQALLVPLLLSAWTPQSIIAKHTLSIGFKLLLVIPISALAYELIRYAARLPDGIWARLLRAPGLALQRLTAYEPDERQMEVAVVALAEALGRDAEAEIRTPPYARL